MVAGEEVIGCMKRSSRYGDFRANFSLEGSVELFEANEEVLALVIKRQKLVIL